MLKLFTLRGSVLVEAGNTCADDDTDRDAPWDQALSMPILPLLLVCGAVGGAMGGAAGGGGAW